MNVFTMAYHEAQTIHGISSEIRHVLQKDVNILVYSPHDTYTKGLFYCEEISSKFPQVETGVVDVSHSFVLSSDGCEQVAEFVQKSLKDIE